jgi:hypothetical protein
MQQAYQIVMHCDVIAVVLTRLARAKTGEPGLGCAEAETAPASFFPSAVEFLHNILPLTSLFDPLSLYLMAQQLNTSTCQ